LRNRPGISTLGLERRGARRTWVRRARRPRNPDEREFLQLQRAREDQLDSCRACLIGVQEAANVCGSSWAARAACLGRKVFDRMNRKLESEITILVNQGPARGWGLALPPNSNRPKSVAWPGNKKDLFFSGSDLDWPEGGRAPGILRAQGDEKRKQHPSSLKQIREPVARSRCHLHRRQNGPGW